MTDNWYGRDAKEKHEAEVQRILKIMNDTGYRTFVLCGGEMTDIPFIEEPWKMAQKLMEDHNER